MYSRPQRGDEGNLMIPENYDGTAFMEKPIEPPDTPTERSIKVIGAPTAESKVSPVIKPTNESKDDEKEKPHPNSEKDIPVFGFLEKLPLAGLFKRGGLLGEHIGIKFPKIGTEEILIIAMALLLFFSKSGDKECAIMLALLLLVSN